MNPVLRQESNGQRPPLASHRHETGLGPGEHTHTRSNRGRSPVERRGRLGRLDGRRCVRAGWAGSRADRPNLPGCRRPQGAAPVAHLLDHQWDDLPAYGGWRGRRLGRWSRPYVRRSPSISGGCRATAVPVTLWPRFKGEKRVAVPPQDSSRPAVDGRDIRSAAAMTASGPDQTGFPCYSAITGNFSFFWRKIAYQLAWSLAIFRRNYEFII